VEQGTVFDILRRELTAREHTRAKTRFSLLETRRRAERKSREQAREKREEQFRAAMDLEEKSDAGKEKNTKDKEKPDELVSEVLLREAANIAADIASTPDRHATALSFPADGPWNDGFSH